MSKERGYYAALSLGRARRKPSIERVSKKRLNAIDARMREAGHDEYDLSIMWSHLYFVWVLYAVVMFDQG